MKYNSVIIGLILLFTSASYAFTCDRAPAQPAESPKENIDRYTIEVLGNPTTYSPGEIYTIVLKSNASHVNRAHFTKFMLVVEPANPSEHADVVSGELTPVDYAVAKFTPKCPNAVIQTNILGKTEVELYWKAPPSDNGCVAFKATVYETSDSWFADQGGLTKILCEEDENENYQAAPLEECSACNEAKYEVAFQRLWRRNTHPKDYPPNMWSTKLGEVIGASHKYGKSFWEYDSPAPPGLKLLAEEGNTTLLEDDLKDKIKNDDIRTIIKARELAYPNIIGTSYTVFRVDQQHHLISLVSKIVPSPDWFVGVANLELCTAKGDWLESKVLNLYPWDAGTDDGKTYKDLRSPSDPPQPTRRLTAADEDTPFYNKDNESIKPFAKLRVTRQKLYEKSCESPDDCELGEWGEWSNCSTTCGKPVRTRDRDLVNPENLDQCTTDGSLELQTTEDCEATEEECELSQCVNATWSAWTPCSVTCGIGLKTRDGTFPTEETTEAENTENEEEAPCKEAVECYLPPCQEETTTEAADQVPMSSESQVTDPVHILTQGPTGPVVDCKLSRWSHWGRCEAEPCESGYQTRERHIEVHPSNGGKACKKILRKRRPCKAPCPDEAEEIDCKLGPWTNWSPCSSNCGSSALRQKTRNIEVYPSKNGKPCGPRIMTQKCPLPYACSDSESVGLNRKH